MARDILDTELSGGSLDLGPLRSPSITVGTLSFLDSETALAGDDLLEALEHGFRDPSSVPNLIVVAGRTLAEVPEADRILAASRNVPVLMEGPNSGTGPYRWTVSHGSAEQPRTTVLRGGQLVRSSVDEDHRFGALAQALADGKGFIRFGDDLLLVLLICGENNLFCTAEDANHLFKSTPVARAEALDVALGGPWIALNPAHGPYGNSLLGGKSKIARHLGRGPTLSRVANGKRRKDAREPIALIHCNNFSDSDERLHALVFSEPERAAKLEEVERDSRWRACSFGVSVRIGN